MPLNDDQLESLLHEAVRAVGVPEVSGDLAGQVRQKYARRKRGIRLNAALATAALLLCAGIYSSFITHHSSFVPPSPALSLEERIAELDRKLDQLAVRIGQQENTLARMAEYQRVLAADGPRAADMTEYGIELRQKIQAEQTGYMLVGLGEDYLALSQPDRATKNFQQVVENLPATAAAEKARMHLAGLGIRD
jgi:prefoldin subunit 5